MPEDIQILDETVISADRSEQPITSRRIVGNPDPLHYFLENLGKWPSAVAIATQWFVNLDIKGVPALQGALLNKNLLKLEPGSLSWAINSDVSDRLMSDEFHNMPERLTGCVFAQQVDLPSETALASYDGLDYGGFQAPPTISGRKAYENFSIIFMETNASFLDFVIRPWVILTSQFGLISRERKSPKNVRCPLISVYMLAKAGQEDPLAIRKIYHFVNAAPVSIQSETYSYQQPGLKVSKVDFVYDYYYVTSEDSEGYTDNGSNTTNTRF